MVVDMPYGMVVINSASIATYFIKNHCKDCWMNNMCSHDQMNKCDKTIQQVVKHYHVDEERCESYETH